MPGSEKFFAWQNLTNSLAQAIVIVGLITIGETVVVASVLVGTGTVGSLGILPTGITIIAARLAI
jgi:hypothetical protein